MIPAAYIETASDFIHWQTLDQVEHDLIISRAIVDLYKEPHIKNVLAFRGGTALNKLFVKPAARYSEDLDFVQTKAIGIGQTLDVIRDILRPWLGEPRWKITERSAKLIYKYESVTGVLAKLKVEINTTEHFQVLPLQEECFGVDSQWFSGETGVFTYKIDELIATKLRALYQRRKGRDLYDLWYVVSNNMIDLDLMLKIFSQYCEYNKMRITGKAFVRNMEQKKGNVDFRNDMSALLPSGVDWDFHAAYQFVVDSIISRLP